MNDDKKENEKNKKVYKYEILPEDYAGEKHLNFKLIIIGDSGVRKSCLTCKAIKNTFVDNYYATIGFEYSSFNIKINDILIKLQIWDTCGQELYRSLVSNFYRNSSLGIIVYAINSRQSFEDIEQWLKELKTYSNPDIKVFLIGNKVDLENERVISKNEGETFANDNNFFLFMETSAKTGFNAQNIFIEAAKILYEDYIKYKAKFDTNNNDIRQNLKKLNPSNKKGGCC